MKMKKWPKIRNSPAPTSSVKWRGPGVTHSSEQEVRRTGADQHHDHRRDGHDRAGDMAGDPPPGDIARGRKDGVGERQNRIDRNALHGRLRHHQRAGEAEADQRHAQPPIFSRKRIETPSRIEQRVIWPSATTSAIGMLASATT